MKVLMIGDVVGQGGCDYLRRTLPLLKRDYQADLTIVNGENSAEGNGITPQSATALFDSGADVITTGNHALRRREVYDLLEEGEAILRPANLHREAPGVGCYLWEKGRLRVQVVNLLGSVYLDSSENPFDAMERVLEETDTPLVIVDFHAEATAEKIAFARYFDGRASLIVGTHTHVQTADETIFPGGTGYITDLGMCGGVESVLGVKIPLAVQKLRTRLPVRFENAGGPMKLGGIFAQIDEKTGKTVEIRRISLVQTI